MSPTSIICLHFRFVSLPLDKRDILRLSKPIFLKQNFSLPHQRGLTWNKQLIAQDFAGSPLGVRFSTALPSILDE